MFTLTRPFRILNRKPALAIIRSLTTALLLTSVGCSPQPQPQAKTLAAIFLDNPTAEATLRACLYNAYQQGLSMKQAFDICRVDLSNRFGRGTIDLDPLGDGGIRLSGSGSEDPVQFGAGACGGQSDPKLSRGKVIPVDGPHGGYSYGGEKGEGFNNGSGDWGMYAGLSENEARIAKEAKIKEWEDAAEKSIAPYVEYQQAEAARDAVLKDPKATSADKNAAELKAAETQKTLKEAAAAADEAWKKAQADPNKLPPNVVRPSLSNPCLEAMQKAAEFLTECNRSGWTSPGCAALQARMSKCPDPALIYPNPVDGSLSCGESIDSGEIEKAWANGCDRRKILYGPNQIPCPPLRVTGGRAVVVRGDVCSDPRAYVSDDNCVVFIQTAHDLRETLTRDVSDIVVWAVDHQLGGPVIVLPVGPPGPAGPHPW